MKRATSHPSSGTNAVTSGPTPTSKARRPAAYSTARSIPSNSVFAPPIRSTKTSPPTSTLKLRFVIPPPSSSTAAMRPGHKRATAARAAFTSPGWYLLEWPRDGGAQSNGDRAGRASGQVRSPGHHQRPPGDGGPRQRLRDLGRQRQALRRLRGRHRRDERGTRPPTRHEGGAGAARPRDPYLVPGCALRVLPATRRAPLRGRPDRRPEEGRLLQHRR